MARDKDFLTELKGIVAGLAENLDWEWDRTSSSGNETIKPLLDKLIKVTNDEIKWRNGIIREILSAGGIDSKKAVDAGILDEIKNHMLTNSEKGKE